MGAENSYGILLIRARRKRDGFGIGEMFQKLNLNEIPPMSWFVE